MGPRAFSQVRHITVPPLELGLPKRKGGRERPPHFYDEFSRTWIQAGVRNLISSNFVVFAVFELGEEAGPFGFLDGPSLAIVLSSG